MFDIVNLMKQQPDFYSLDGSTMQEIARAEHALGVCFAEDYCKYISVLGVASFGGHELTGVCQSKRLNVVDVTITERVQNPTVPSDWYVVEQTNIDNITVWQSTSGAVYLLQPNQKPRKIGTSLAQYLNL